MTNTVAIGILIFVAGFLAVDGTVYGWDMSLFLSRKFADLLFWMAFWR